MHFDPKILLNLSGKHLYDTHEFKLAWKFGVKNSKCTMHISLASVTQIFQSLLRYFQFTQIIIDTIAKVCLKYSNISAFWLQNSATFDTNILVWHTRVQVGLKVWCQNLKMYYAYLTRISYSDIWYLLRLLLKIWVQISE